MNDGNNISIGKSPLNYIITSLLFLILYMPTKFQIIKILLLFIMLFYLFLSGLSKSELMLSKSILRWTVLYMAFNVIFLFIGIHNNPNSEVLNIFGPVKIVWPILYFLTIIILFSSSKVNVNFEKLFWALGVILPLLMIVTFLLGMRGISMPFIDSLFNFQISGFGGFNSYFTPAITSLFFLGSFSIVYVLSAPKKKIYWLIPTSLIVLAALLIGRRALLFTLLLAPALYLIIETIQKGINIRALKNLILLFSVGAAFTIIVLKYSGLNLRIFQLDNVVVQSDLRSSQFESLIKGWKNNPFFGSGFGSNAGVVRSKTSGMYELSYAALLFQTGIAGFIGYLSLYFYLFIKLCKMYKKTSRKYYLAVAIGYMDLMVANATNPYIDSFDGMWIIFFLLAIINRYEVTKRNSREVL
ncbi:O-antigen ligase family protein [Dellaglioa algida]|uniref:O-antigen ligase family protein n=1 Tax=Dellaglioa algida TaxID=105612 RepID=UPI0024C484F0|nr:hypothetical protein [Dellaglioa algida]MDK1725891.1 hypothetical protein [Dellaglioa algida]